MNKNALGRYDLKACQNNEVVVRYLNPADINIAEGYKIEVFAQGLDAPVSMLFTESGDMIIAESGFTTGNPRILRLVNETFEVIADGFNVPLTGINYYEGVLYVSHRGSISIVELDGTRRNIIIGLPSNGDYYNNRVVIGPDEKMYFGQGTATNSGVVGLDNEWILSTPLLCDYPGDDIMLYGQNFVTDNILIERPDSENVFTGAYSPYGVPNVPSEVKKGVLRASGSILRANLDGTGLKIFAWGFRNPAYMRFDEGGNLFVANNGYEVRGSRPIANAFDEFYYVTPRAWFGWPDYNGGEPVNLPKFKPEGGVQPEFLLKYHPGIPPKPYAIFPAQSSIMGFDFNYDRAFGPYAVYIAEFGSTAPRRGGLNTPYRGAGQRISKIDMISGSVSTFAINKSGFPASMTLEGGFERPADVLFGPDKGMYILDMGWNERYDPSVFIPNTEVIWKVTKI